MVVGNELAIKPFLSESIEKVIQDWKELMDVEWVEEILAKPDTQFQVQRLAEKVHLTLPEAWANYFSLQFTSQI